MNNDLFNGQRSIPIQLDTTSHSNCAHHFHKGNIKPCHFNGRNFIGDKNIENDIKKHISEFDDVVEFFWKAKKTNLNTLTDYKKVIELQTKHANGKTIKNNLQVYDFTLSHALCEFLNKYHWCINLTITGPGEFYGTYDVIQRGIISPTKTKNIIALLRSYQIGFSLLVVLNAINILHPEKLYHYAKSLGANNINFIPLIKLHKLKAINKGSDTSKTREGPKQTQVTPCSVSAHAFGEFLSRVLYIWVRKDIGKVFVNIFESTLASWRGCSVKACVLEKKHVHDVDNRGNENVDIADHHLEGNCKQCVFLTLCEGDRHELHFVALTLEEWHHDYLCDGYMMFYRHAAPYMNTMRGLIARGIHPSQLMKLIKQREETKKQKQVIKVAIHV